MRGAPPTNLRRTASAAAVINLPWLNRVDDEWVRTVLGQFPLVVTLDNHYVALGQGVMIAAALARLRVESDVRSLGLTDIPACGSNAEVLEHHGLDAASIVARGSGATCIPNTLTTGSPTPKWLPRTAIRSRSAVRSTTVSSLV